MEKEPSKTQAFGDLEEDVLPLYESELSARDACNQSTRMRLSSRKYHSISSRQDSRVIRNR
eukprot:9486745-Ditylum_brightwellii.AAC.1